MHSLNIKNITRTKEKDRTAKILLNLGRTTGKIRPYVINNRNLAQIVILDTELLDRFILFCSRLEMYGLTDTEMLLFLIKQSTETNTRINDIERAQVFEKLSDEILNLVELKTTTEKSITDEWRIDSEKNENRM